MTGAREAPGEWANDCARAVRWLALLAGGMGVLGGLLGCNDDVDEPSELEEAATEVQVWTVEGETLEARRSWSGRLEPLRTLSVQAQAPGRVTAVEAREGDRVARGDVLVRLSAPELEARYQVLEERFEHLSDELDRWRRLADADAAGPMEVSEATRRLLEAQEVLAETQAMLEARVIYAPATGQVAAINVGIGSEVDAGQALLRVDDAGTPGVRLTVPARETSLFDDLDRLTLQDDRGNDLRVDRVAYSPAEHSGFVEAELFLDGDSNGRVGQVDVDYRADEEVLVVPWTAVASDEDDHWVALITGDPPVVERRVVDLGRGHPLGIEVLDGLASGDRVLRYEPRAHPEGQEVQPLDPEQ